jgi:hypothetical protein
MLPGAARQPRHRGPGLISSRDPEHRHGVSLRESRGRGPAFLAGALGRRPPSRYLAAVWGSASVLGGGA